MLAGKTANLKLFKARPRMRGLAMTADTENIARAVSAIAGIKPRIVNERLAPGDSIFYAVAVLCGIICRTQGAEKLQVATTRAARIIKGAIIR